MVQWLKRVIWHLVLEISINENQGSGNHVSGGLPIASLDSKSQLDFSKVGVLLADLFLVGGNV